MAYLDAGYVETIRKAKRHEKDGQVVFHLRCNCVVRVRDRHVCFVRTDKCRHPHKIFGAIGQRNHSRK